MPNDNLDSKYNDIINLPHHVSDHRPQMPRRDRAAQFAPFAAVVGYDSAINETARLTDERVDPDESVMEEINARFQILQEHLNEQPAISIIYFKPDKKKSGGAYITVSGVVKKIDEYERRVTMSDGVVIPMDDIVGFEGELFHLPED